MSLKLGKTKQKEPQKKTILERRWSAITSATSFRRKKRESFIYQPNESANSPKVDYVRVSKSEYEEIKNRVSAIEKRLSFELDNVQSTAIHDEVNIIHDIQSAYEQTLEQTELLSPGTDQLARRLSRDLKIRNSKEKVIRSPSARKIGNIRRRSREAERPTKISRIPPMQNVSNDLIVTGISKHISYPIRSELSEKPVKIYSNAMVSLNTPRNSYELDSLEYTEEIRNRPAKVMREQRGLKRSSSSATPYNYSPLKDRFTNFNPRRSLELVPLNDSNKENGLITIESHTPKMPLIKRAIPVSRTPKRLCITPCSSRVNTPLRVLPNNFKMPNF